LALIFSPGVDIVIAERRVKSDSIPNQIGERPFEFFDEVSLVAVGVDVVARSEDEIERLAPVRGEHLSGYVELVIIARSPVAK
jgi:hypothetical protein